MVINKQASGAVVSFFTNTAKLLGRAGKAAGSAAKWSWKVGGGASKIAGKSLSFTGSAERVASRMQKFTSHVGKLSHELSASLLKSAQSPEKAQQIISIAQKNGMITDDVLAAVTKDKALLDELAKHGYNTSKGLENTIATAKNSPEVVGAYNQAVIKNLSHGVKGSAQPIETFLNTVRTEGSVMLNQAVDPARKKDILRALKELDDAIVNHGVYSEDFIKAANGIKSLDKVRGATILQQAQLVKGNKSITFLTELNNAKLLGTEGRATSNALMNSFKQLQFVSASNAFSFKNIVGGTAAISTILFGASMAGAGLVGENVKLIKKTKEITNKMKDELNSLPVQDGPIGEGWKKERDRLISNLSSLDSVDLASYENASGSNLTEEGIENIIIGLEDLSKRFEIIGKTFEEIATSKALEAIYEKGSAGLAQDVGGAVDTLTGGLFGNVTAYNKTKELANNGLQALAESGAKISKSSEELHKKLEEGNVEGAEIESNASFIAQQFISTGYLLDKSLSFKDSDIVVKKINKNAAAPLAVAGTVLQVLSYIMLAGDAVNAVVKGYSRFSDDYDKLSENIKSILKYVESFNEFKAESESAVEFKNSNEKLLQILRDSLKFLEANIKDIDSVIENEDMNKIAEMIADKKKLQEIKTVLNNVSTIYETFMSEKWKAQYSEFAKSWFQSALSAAGFATFFSGEGIFDSYSRFIYTAKPGASMISGLKVQIDKLIESNENIKTEAEKQQ